MKSFSVPTVLAVTLLFFGGVYVGASGLWVKAIPASFATAFDGTSPEQVDMTPVWRVWNALDEKYVPTHALKPGDKEPTKQDRIWGMAEGLAASLGDPYTTFFPPQENEQFKDDISGSFEGVGMEIAVKDGQLQVVSPLKSSPAERAGLKPQDKILKIDDLSTAGLTVESAVKKIRGPKNSVVKLTIMREGWAKEQVISVVRDTIVVPVVKTKTLPGNIFVIEFSSFAETSPEKFKQALQEFQDSKSDKLVIDMRGNPGGYLNAAVDIASWFLPGGSTVVTEDYAGKRESVIHRSAGYNIFNDKLKMVILQDKGSASAAEILTGALKYYKKATVIGTKSFGKGSVQELVEITPETSLKVTVARWIMPDGKNISGEGIDPDIEVKLPTDQATIDKLTKAKRDLIMERAQQFFKTGK
jgi:carboxyl-terminal processing protease